MRVVEQPSLEAIAQFIDWTPFFHTWELRGVYPKILQHEKHGEEARKLLADAQKMLNEIVEKTNVSQPTVSHHLAVLREAGLVDVRHEGKQAYYTLNQLVKK